jgi:hypothetical protein
VLAPEISVTVQQGIENALTNPAKSLSLAMHQFGQPRAGVIPFGVDPFLQQLGGMIQVGNQILDRFEGEMGSRGVRVDARKKLGEVDAWTKYSMLNRSGGDAKDPLQVPEVVVGLASAVARRGSRLAKYWREMELAGSAPHSMAEYMGIAVTPRPAERHDPEAQQLAKLKELESRINSHGLAQRSKRGRRVAIPAGWVRADHAGIVCGVPYTSLVEYCRRRAKVNTGEARPDEETGVWMIRVDILSSYLERRRNGT